MNLKRLIRTPLEKIYIKRLEKRVASFKQPKHIAVILDGNRRWAALQGGPTSRGHRVGAGKIEELLDWCEKHNVKVVTLWLLSTDNLQRSDSEVIPLLGIIENVAKELAGQKKWKLRALGHLPLLPERTRQVLVGVERDTEIIDGITVNLAVGYGGRRELLDAVKSLVGELESSQRGEIADAITLEAIESHLYTSGQPDPDLVIRTSGEQRLSGFLMWQSAHSEFWFCDAYWPDFRYIDFLRALRDYGLRQRRYGA
ncbi:MAG: isoprenyl transferase [Candidatus Nanopelagicales bacterium]